MKKPTYAPPKKIGIFGEQPVESAPSLSVAALLRQSGYLVELVELPDTALGCLSKFRNFDCAIYIDYGRPSDWLIRQAAIINLVNVPLIRWWVGSDVFYVVSDESVGRQSRKLDKCMHANAAVSPHLVEELKSSDIEASVVPIIPERLPDLNVTWNSKKAQHVLVYLPTEREDFYGARLLDELIPLHPDITFVLVANSGMRYKEFSNVVAYEWVEDMEPIYTEIGCLLRCTKHDGLPRMVIEALARGKYVIYSWPFEGCELALNATEASLALKMLVNRTDMNKEGAEIVREKYSQQAFSESFSSLFHKSRPSRFAYFFNTMLLVVSIVGNRLKSVYLGGD